MRAILAAGLTLVALLPAPARAGNQPVLVGTTCGLVALEHPDATGQSYEGVMGAAVTAVDGTYLTANPVPVSLTCRLMLGGHEINTMSSVLTSGAAAVADRVSFQAFDADYYQVCTDIVAIGASATNTQRRCDAVTRSTVPPWEVCDPVSMCGRPVQPATVLYVIPQTFP